MRVSKFSPGSKFQPVLLRGPISSNMSVISGTVKELGIPVSRKVLLYLRSTGELVETTMSDPTTGYYQFDVNNITKVYFIVALDDDEGVEYNALICDRQQGI